MNKLLRRLTPLIVLATVILGVIALKYGKPVLMPMALALLFTFLLNPIVSWLERHKVGRISSVLTVVFVVFTLVGVITWALGRQITGLALELPKYKDNIREKINDLQTAGKGGAFERIQTTIKELKGELKKEKQEQEARSVT
ncbi:MAG: AI-2E family transporter, partial [Verrucomicrobiota bacterium]|nr:AI-2E family transporter [Verrucomicrobiota bacterium]